VKPISLFVVILPLIALPPLHSRQPPSTSSQKPLWAQMQQAVLYKQDLKEIRGILKAGFNINDPIGCGTFNSVDGAVGVGNVEILNFLLANGAQPKESALLQAVWCRKPEVSFRLVEALLKAGADAGYKDYYPKEWNAGDTHKPDTNRFNSALHIACYQGYFEVVNLLLSHPGVELNGLNIDGRTPLMSAAAQGNEKIVALLLAKGANVDIKNGRGETAATVAAKRNGDRSKILQVLAKARNVAELGVTNRALRSPGGTRQSSTKY
jgi:hypothetical protein